MANEEKFTEVRHRQVATNGITMHVAEQGGLSAPPVLLLHGFLPNLTVRISLPQFIF
jgi:pimeloyl-ACP methyl ester carboxylesterase